ncbi:hypothetical protein D6D05_08304 [Aureobasidium pullulans]|nr:hypothetical protein D6D05_08304 [Aureobasidium pullulans]
MASSPQSPASANDVLTSHSSDGHHHQTSASPSQDHCQTTISPSQDHCHTSLSPVNKDRQTSPSLGADMNDMLSLTEKLPTIVSASVPETTKPPQSRLGLLSLPPEIRNMIYDFLFTPVQDGTCWAVRANFLDTSLSGVRLPCYLCSKGSIHTFCTCVHPRQDTTHTAYTVFTLTNKHIHSNIHQTCRTIMNESRALSLAHMLISIACNFNYAGAVHRSFGRFLANMGSPEGAYLACLSCTSHDGHKSKYKLDYALSLSTFINEKRIKIGYLELKECWARDFQPISMLEFCVDFLQSLDDKPATVRWQTSDYKSGSSYKDEMDAFNNVVGAWLEATYNSKAKKSHTKMPLLRNFLPQYLDQPQT